VTESWTHDDESRDGGAAGAERLRAQREALAQPRSFLSMIPRRDLTKGVLLLVFLAVIIGLQQRSDSIVKKLTEGLFGPPPPARVTTPAAPRVQLAAPVKAP
jgi:hypothetical protein